MIEQRDRRRCIGDFGFFLIQALIIRRVLCLRVICLPRQLICLYIGVLRSLLDHRFKLCVFIERRFDVLDAAVMFGRQTVHFRFRNRNVVMVEDRHIYINILQIFAFDMGERFSAVSAEYERDLFHLLFILASAAARCFDRIFFLIRLRLRLYTPFAAANIFLCFFDDIGGFFLVVVVKIVVVVVIVLVVEIIDKALVAACGSIDDSAPHPDKRLRNDFEHFDNAAVGQQHDQDNDNQQNDNPCANDVECRDKRYHDYAGDQSAAAKCLSVFKEQLHGLLKADLGAGYGVDTQQGIAKEYLYERTDKERQQNAPDGSAGRQTAAVLSDQIARIDQDCRNENDADSEYAKQRFMEYQPELAARNNRERCRQNTACEKQYRTYLIGWRFRRRSRELGICFGRLCGRCCRDTAGRGCFARRGLRRVFGRSFRCVFLRCLFGAGLSGCFLFCHDCTFLSYGIMLGVSRISYAYALAKKIQ